MLMTPNFGGSHLIARLLLREMRCCNYLWRQGPDIHNKPVYIQSYDEWGVVLEAFQGDSRAPKLNSKVANQGVKFWPCYRRLVC
jgi:hypothetical protein